MCGICGLVSLKKPPLRKILLKMNKTLIHRGPDQGGFFLNRKVGLAVRRLAIIDTIIGKQPIFNEDKSCVIVYNGEVYNFLALKEDLIKKGHRFKTNTDTEVILHLYEDLGPLCLEKIHGMFAFAIWNIKKNSLFLARDHFGIKPLHYYFKNNLFLFASEIKAIINHPQVKKEVDFEALNQYFSTGFGCIPAPRTIFMNIKKLLPCHYLIFQNNKISLKKYWHLEKIKKLNLSFLEAKEHLRSLLEQSVKEQIMADKKVFGSFLSGGIDSSIIAALVAKAMTGKLKTFSIGFEDSSFDESGFAKIVAQHIQTEHHHQFLTNKELLEILPALAQNIDEPFADSSLLPCLLLSTFARKHVKVAFSGDGGDELFAGYPTYQAHQLWPLYQKIPRVIRKKIIAPLIRSLPTSFNNVSLDFKLKRFIRAEGLNPAARHLAWLAPFPSQEKKNLFTKTIYQTISSKESTGELFSKYFREPNDFVLIDRLQYLDLKTYLADFGLVKTDRTSSLASLELRSPFLNPKIAEFVFSLPSDFRLKGLTTKYILKQTVTDLLPKKIINRPKKGFGAPIAQWINKDLKKLIANKLAPKRIKKQDIFNTQTVQQLVEEHWNRKKDNRMKIWSLFMFQLWYDNYM